MIKDLSLKLQEKLKNLPSEPGSYQYYSKDGEIIYVGKAKNLANRVRSYFMGTHDAKTTKLVSEIDDLEYIITSSETEALILEINLIKKYNPRYNIMLTDDKQYPYIIITNEDYPRILYTRDIKKTKAKVFGPYPNAKAAKDVTELLNRMLPFRKCRYIPKKECLYYHMGQCLGPCINKVSKEDYEPIKAKAVKILKRNVHDEIKYFDNLMQNASNELNFEKAIEYRNIKDALEAVSERQKMEGYVSDTDVFAYYSNNEYLSIQVFHLRDGKMLERSGYLVESNENDIEKFEEFVYNFYLVENNPVPKQIYLSCGNAKEFEDILQTHVSVPVKGKNANLVSLVSENAKNKIDTLIKKQDYIYKRGQGANIELSKLLGFEIHKIEAFDNSNIQGASPVSAMVVYIDGAPCKKLYRKFKVKTVVGANDAATMYEIVTRRYEDVNNKPDLIIMDGGQIQVHSCINALKDVKRDIPVLGLVKDDNHKTRALYYNDKEIEIEKGGYLFKFLESIQEEVHRYAITFFRSTHNKNMFSSQIDEIKGIGKVKKAQILKILSSETFEEDLNNIRLNDEQRKEIIKIFKTYNI